MKNVVIYKLDLEVTRKCNLKCVHCMRGNALNYDVDKEAIDKFFCGDEHSVKAIQSLMLTGGEPSLASDSTYEYLTETVKRNISYVDYIGIILNGTIFNENMIKCLNGILNYHNLFSNIEIQFSTDKFHPMINKDIYNAYKELEKKYKVRVLPLNSRDMMNKTINNNPFNIGNAKINQIGKKMVFEDQLLVPLDSIDGDDYITVLEMYLNALGYVTKRGNGSYETMDQMNLGNIKTKSLLKMRH